MRRTHHTANPTYGNQRLRQTFSLPEPGQQDAYANPNQPLAPGVGDAVADFVRRSAH